MAKVCLKSERRNTKKAKVKKAKVNSKAAGLSYLNVFGVREVTEGLDNPESLLGLS